MRIPDAVYITPVAQMLTVAGWESSKHNMGMAFNHNFWSKMQSCADTFCGYDDYNWDWSVEATLSDCPAFRGSAQTAALVLGGARVCVGPRPKQHPTSRSTS